MPHTVTIIYRNEETLRHITQVLRLKHFGIEHQKEGVLKDEFGHRYRLNSSLLPTKPFQNAQKRHNGYSKAVMSTHLSRLDPLHPKLLS